MIEMQVRVDDHVDAAEVKFLLVQWLEARIHIGHQRVNLGHPRVDQHAAIRMVDDVDIDRHRLAVGEQIGNVDGRDRGLRRSVHRLLRRLIGYPSSLLRTSARQVHSGPIGQGRSGVTSFLGVIRPISNGGARRPGKPPWHGWSDPPS